MAVGQFTCPHCAGAFQIDLAHGGRQVSCPLCRGVVTLPSVMSMTPPAPWSPEPEPESGFPGIKTFSESRRRGSRKIDLPGEAREPEPMQVGPGVPQGMAV